MKKFIAFGLAALAASCGGNVGHKDSMTLHLTPTNYETVRGWRHVDFSGSLQAFKSSCSQITKRAPRTAVARHPFFGGPAAWDALCNEARRTDISYARAFFERNFVPVRVAGASGQSVGTFTGYYEPELKGSFTPGGQYKYPLYARPTVGGALPSRGEIVRGALKGRARPILWVDSEIDAFFLHIQGSGRVRLPDNRVIRVAYAGQNGHKYYPIGRYLKEKGHIPADRVSLQSIKRWLRDNPGQSRAVMDLNPSYVFFKTERIRDAQSAKGAAGVPLIPEYSLAVDDDYYPYGIPIWVETGVNVPAADGSEQKMAFERLMIAQDTGGAIKGPVRGDIFFGSGDLAEFMAGKQKSKGRQLLLLPKDAVFAASG